MRRAFAVLLGGLGLLLLAGLLWGPGAVERATQGVLPHAAYQIDANSLAHHRRLTVVDWHADTLLWKRDLLERSDRGHVDLPRLEAGNVAVQVFTAVTRSPAGQNYARNRVDRDNNTLLALIQLWPPRTWTSLLERALYQAERLEGFAARAPERLRVVRTAADLRGVLADRRRGRGAIGAILGIEGAHALEGKLDHVDALFAAGYRVIGLQHFFDNELGGSLHGEAKGGLTDFGRAVVAQLEARSIIVDLAHSSRAVVDDVLAMARRPLVVSHTGVHGACASLRNLPDAQLRRIARAGGLIAIGFWEGAVCDITPRGVVKSLRYASDLLGVEHVALGSDFDGGTTTRFDAAELAVLTQEMRAAGFDAGEIEKIMGGNAVRFLLAQLPQ